MDKKANILFVANWESDVGYAWWLMEGFWKTIANHLEKQDIHSILIYPKITTLPDTIAHSNITVKELDFKKSSRIGLKNIHKLIKQNNIRYIYLTDSPSYCWKYLLLRLYGVKKIIVHDHTPGERNQSKGIKKLIKILIQRIPFYTADHFIGVTEFVLKRFKTSLCIPEHKCSVAPNGIYPIDLSNANMNYAQQEFNIAKDKTIVVTTGRATYYKGIDFFIDCAHEIINTKKLNNFHFLYCGAGPDLEEFKLRVENYNLSSNFTFAGRRNDIREILPSCHIGFHAATGEVGYSLSILEYMSARMVTIVPDNPSTSLATTHDSTGYLYERKSLSSAVNTILMASKNTPHTDEIRNSAKKYVDECLTIDKTHQALKSIIDHVINSESPHN